MIFRNIAFCLCAVTALTACETVSSLPSVFSSKKQQPHTIVEPSYKQTRNNHELSPGMITHDITTAGLMTNENVIVFPVEGEIDMARKTFPEYRSVIENTTAGGYTVFDPSVTVFAVDDAGIGVRPDYLPQYSVPRYAEQFHGRKPVQAPLYAGEPLPLTANYPVSSYPSIPVKPAYVSPEIISIAPAIQAEPLPRPPRMTEAGRISVPDMYPETPLTRANVSQQRRNGPVLTGY